ncbi:hypothetical protein KAR91_52590 [Candidatus Pacearchaeota archaeon]|nr:hypothetical protein [Candidatus Pacearchaeota archaeon]
MFEKASRLKIRFRTDKGDLTVEDLWDLPLTSTRGISLDDIAMDLNKAVKDSEEESFVLKKNEANDTLDLMFGIVKHIIKIKIDENDARIKASENKAKKEHLLSVIADKESDALKGKSIEELKKLVEDL